MSQTISQWKCATGALPQSDRVVKPKRFGDAIRLSAQLMQDRRELLALRREVASSLAKQLCQSDMNGTAPLHVVSADGYRVFRIGMGWAELLLAVRGTMGDLEVRYAYLNEREEEPVLCKMRLREPEISLGALGNAGC